LISAAGALTASAGAGAAGGASGVLGDIGSAAGFFGLFEQGGIVPSAAGGMITGGLGSQLAILHAREMVLPAHISAGLQAMIQGRSATANLNYSPTINTARGRSGTGMTRSEFSKMMNLHSGAMLGEARNMMRAGWRP
jgi:hypothetical protein